MEPDREKHWLGLFATGITPIFFVASMTLLWQTHQKVGLIEAAMDYRFQEMNNKIDKNQTEMNNKIDRWAMNVENKYDNKLAKVDSELFQIKTEISRAQAQMIGIDLLREIRNIIEISGLPKENKTAAGVSNVIQRHIELRDKEDRK